MEEKKKCGKCKAEKEIGFFSPGELKKSYIQCKDCIKEYNKQKRAKEVKPIKIIIETPLTGIQKLCLKCDKEKDISLFFADSKSGKPASPCKDCRKEAKNFSDQNPSLKKLKVRQSDKDIKFCCQCKKELIQNDNWAEYLYNKPYYICNCCNSVQKKLHREKDLEKTNRLKRESYDRNKESINEKKRVENLSPEQIEEKRGINKEYRERKNKEINARRRKRKKERFLNDPNYKIREIFGTSFRDSLKTKNIDKKSSCFDILDYTLQDLMSHLEKQFEPWMNWKNHGVYNRNAWIDGNESTYTWQIDHIIPKANFQFSNENYDEIKKCWALNNLRPYSAKQNNIDGGTKVRHIKNNKENENAR